MNEEMEGIVRIGDKPILNYVNAVIRQVLKNKKVSVQARGHQTGKAIDVALITIKQMKESERQIDIEEVSIRSDYMKNSQNEDMRVSVIEIMLLLQDKEGEN